jgi:mono/diheme cytochrome c family protein
MSSVARLCVLLMAATAVACMRPADAREARDFERMRRQQRYNAFDTSRFFANGAAMQAAPAHVVSRGPVVGTDFDSTRGAEHYAISCAPCHGAGGYGGGPIAPNLPDKRPPSLRAQKVTQLPESTLVAIITDGFGRMPPLGWQLTPAARRAIATFVRTLPTVRSNDAAREDSALADHLRRVDSSYSAGATARDILKLGRAPRGER